MEPAKVGRWYEGRQDCQHSIMEPAKVGRWYEGRQDCQHSIMEPAKIHHTRNGLYIIYVIRYTRYRTSQFLQFWSLWGLFFCALYVIGNIIKSRKNQGCKGGYIIYIR
jgi:hypothetical protein